MVPSHLKADVLLEGFATLFAGVDHIRVRVALMADQRPGVLAALAAFRANEQFALVVVAPQMLLEIVLVLQPALAVGTRALDAWPALLEVQANVLLKDGLVLDLLAADMADIGRLPVLHTHTQEGFQFVDLVQEPIAIIGRVQQRVGLITWGKKS